MAKTYVGDQIVISLNTGSDISGESGFKIKYMKPDGTKGEWVATIDGTMSVKYTTSSTTPDLNIGGNWAVQSYIGSLYLHGEIASIQVYDPIEVP